MRASPLLFLLFLASTAVAQGQDALTTERPGFSSSPYVLAPSVAQIEAGYQFTDSGNDVDVELQNLPLLLVRYGLANNMELQVGWSGYAWADIGGNNIDGITDASVGIKWQVSDERSSVPIALFAGLSIPIGDDNFTTDEVDPSVGAFWSYSSVLDWFGTVVVSEPDDDTQISNALGINLPIREDVGGYVEYYGVYGNGGPEHYLNGGLTYLSRLNLQFDAYLGFGLNDRSADLFVGGGLAYRF